jgi:hypothetical protein
VSNIVFENRMINMDKVMHVYPAVLVPIDDKEMGQVSLEWIDTQDKLDVQIKGYVIAFLFQADLPKEEFFYDTREALEIAIERLRDTLE